MGTQEGDRNWVDVANNLLSRCNVNLKLSTLSECGPDVFVTLYETILGETVPDYIASANSQEDDVHNVQSVIDSLSLDYLQISLSHITGENVVSGDKESIKNLLEIFDGLLEYLNEELNEETQNGATLEPNDPQNEDEADESKKPANLETQQERRSVSPSVENSEETGLAGEVKGSDQTLTAKQQEPAVPPLTSGAVEGAPHQDQMFSAIPLQPPSQRDTPHAPGRPIRAASLSQGSTEETNPDITRVEDSKVTTETLTNGIMSPVHCLSSGGSDDSASSRRRIAAEMEGETLEPTNGGPRRVLFRTQPDVLFLTLRDEVSAITPSPPDTDEDGEVLSHIQRFKDRGTSLRTSTDIGRTVPESPEESLAYRRKRNKEAEEELHHISENLSHRLEELDLMLKRVLGESDGSHSSGSVKRTRRKHRGKPDPDKRKASPSPRRERRSAHGQLEEAMAEALSLDDGKQTNLQVPHHSKRGESHHRSSQRKHLESEAYEEELRRCEERERTELQIARRGAQKAEREYREAILRDVSPSPKPSPGKTKTQQKTQTAAQRRFEVPRKTPSLRIRENELLPLLREELPHLHVSPHALGRMWEQQMQQVDKLHAVSSSRHPHHHKLCKQLEEAQRKHDLLVDLVNRDQDHNRRLREFKERIQQQKSVQSKLREQRQQIARAKKYHNDYHVQHRARLMRARTKEEKMFRQLFEEGLELQKLRLREQRAYAKEQQLEHQRRQQDQFESLENYYKDQFSLLAEKLAHEREEIQVRKKAQEKALLKMKRELRSRMEREIRDLQKIIIQNDEDDHFQNLEVQRLRNQVHMASFQYNTSYLH
ncbi:centrosomal protein of 95 kDa isoform X1 [Poecilia formosa]|uniref:centrosomal protein of 95 kDa isoform X1 n=1 Tax=Poecilia formosa TaxID=48698 RepID=UPI0007BAA724|nr:PREDICTED: centrosomal protein of 95 kDa isoform X1 [Poecilia formosa]